MERLFYPALFHTAEEGGFWVSFPDFPECFSEGDTIQEAYEMAVDALGLAIAESDNKKELPEASAPTEIKVDSTTTFLLVVEFNLEEYRKKHNAKAVKKTLSIPGWMDEEATAMGINFSQVLQEALLQKIQSKC